VSAGSYRLAVVGVDGSGKTSLVARLRERVGVEGDLVTVHAPAFHEHPNAPFQLLSRQLQAVSLAADELALVELKAAMLYLQMTLYGAVERCMVDTFDPRVVVSDRHAVVDTLAYGALYRGLIGAALDGERLAPVLRERLAVAGAPLALDWALSYHERVSRRLGSGSDFWELPHEVAAIFEGEPAQVIAEFVRRYESRPPDAVVVLAIEPAEALARSSRRTAASSEMHENVVALTKLAALYDHALERLARELPGIAIHRIDVTGLSPDETLDALVATLPAAAEPAGARA
jgi:thymidylate kinase